MQTLRSRSSALVDLKRPNHHVLFIFLNPQTSQSLRNQMDPVFNDTETYNIPHNQTFSPYSDSARAMIDPNDPISDEQDAVQSFLRGAEEENARLNESCSTRIHKWPNTPRMMRTVPMQNLFSTLPTCVYISANNLMPMQSQSSIPRDPGPRCIPDKS